MFKKILVANRGEIACRVMRTAKRMGIPTVAVFSDADAGAPHVQMADEAIHIGPSPAAESYLVVDKILDAIKRTGADAVHPGYGFLSENAAFVEALEKAGVAFIGPPTKAIAAMGDKIESKKLADKAGVSTVPGFLGEVPDAKAAVKIAKDVGYPVMIKASAGGGGKGMRIARSDDEVKDGFERAVSEAKSSFGDDRVFIERYVERPRHIEIQVLADQHGNTVYLGERECSIQRRHQKVIEEAPSPFLDEATRKAMGEQAVALAKAVDYTSAGTVEFIVDPDRNFFFLEMNTRLQVEHPVTELITGLDLVEQMIRVAAGEKLSLKQKDVALTGWAVESRLYAEDPIRGFLPSIGRLSHYLPPVASDTVRIDAGVEEGSEISRFYDPMIAKLVTYGDDRETAVTRMGEALDAFHVRGIVHNVTFLRDVVDRPAFRSGDLSTAFIDETWPDGYAPPPPTKTQVSTAAAIAGLIHFRRTVRGANGQAHDWVAVVDGAQVALQVIAGDGGCVVMLDGKSMEVTSAWRPGLPLFEGAVGGAPTVAQIDSLAEGFAITLGPNVINVAVRSPRVAELMSLMPVKEPPDMTKFLLSPMPGMVVSINVEPGQRVEAGHALAVVDAMKMENVLTAEREGTVKALHAAPGDSLAVDQVIVEFE